MIQSADSAIKPDRSRNLRSGYPRWFRLYFNGLQCRDLVGIKTVYRYDHTVGVWFNVDMKRSSGFQRMIENFFAGDRHRQRSSGEAMNN